MRKKQLELNLCKGKCGGRRSGSGRKRIHSRGVAHRSREEVSLRTPLHINFKYRVSIKNKNCLRLLKRAILNARRHGLAVIHFSLQHNHVHLLVEATSNEILTKGMRSLTVTMVKGISKGRIQIERYHLHVLRTLRETKNAVHYVLFNEQRHYGNRIDGFSSLLSLPDALKRAKEFAKSKQVTLILGKIADYGELGLPESFLLKHSLIT